MLASVKKLLILKAESRIRILIQISRSVIGRFSPVSRPFLDAGKIRIDLHVLCGFRNYFQDHMRFLNHFYRQRRFSEFSNKHSERGYGSDFIELVSVFIAASQNFRFDFQSS